MTFKILTDGTHKVIARSNVRPAHSSTERNRRLDMIGGEIKATDKNLKNIVKHRFDTSTGDLPDHYRMPLVHPTDLVGRSFLKEPADNGTRLGAHIVSAIQEHEHDLDQNSTCRQFICRIQGDEKCKDVLLYNEIMSYLNDDIENVPVWKFKRISAHRWQDKQWQVRVEWESGETTWKPLSVITTDSVSYTHLTLPTIYSV